jgi:hypothetical protein
MIRKATAADIPRIFDIRNGVRENRLSDPSKVTDCDVRWFIDNPGIFLSYGWKATPWLASPPQTRATARSGHSFSTTVSNIVA